MAIDPAERLLNLIIALTHARVRMTRAQIRASVVGYEPADTRLSPEEARRREAAFERMFERDKEELRRMGIPLQTVVDPTHGDEIGYKIDASDAAMPGIDFSPAEAAALALAAEYWQGATLGPDAHQGLTKIASTSSAAPRTPLTLGARASSTSDATATIVEARARRMAVSFDYTSASTGLSKRTVQPWQIILRAGAEYLFAFDQDKGEPRTFRLGRIHGNVTMVGREGAYTIPQSLPEAAWGDTGVQHTAILGVRPEAGHAIRRRGEPRGTRDHWDLIEVHYRHADAIKDEVLALAGRARVMSPEPIASAVVEEAAAALLVAEGAGGIETSGGGDRG
ncbi:WYL domain-containing protein [Demequina sp. TTPB684]|uniref:helix-turn-helix transcriptional regulator n=1 Tax=unclassified Demequina TaxID=2620311 RepID=UPI001CF51B2C|nr:MULTISPECIES: WYL domain-containing protein [unclassified Demequina]MCB2413109.1 WYL domain-containing protein [Demequina sp. TTPB684]UPU89271.1 WYL domain-containing protein [Demequina sp. TMPB413]